MKFFFFFVLFLFSSSCFKKNKANKTLYVSSREVYTLDPIYARDAASQIHVSRLYEGVLEYDTSREDLPLRPNLVKEVPSLKKNTHFIFRFRPNIYFHDDSCFPEGKGRSLTAKDFEYTLKRNADPHLASYGYHYLKNKIQGLDEWRENQKSRTKADYQEKVSGLEVLDSLTIKVTLNKSYYDFLHLLTLPHFFIIPLECAQKYKEDFSFHPVGTGPFFLKEMKRNAYFIYENHLRYHQKSLPYIKKIHAQLYHQYQTEVLELLKGNLDLVPLVDQIKQDILTDHSYLNNEMKNKGARILHFPVASTSYILFNHQIPQLKETKVRQAMSLAFNREKAFKQLYRNQAFVMANTLLPNGLEGKDPSYKNPYIRYDISLAKKLLEEAGYPNGKGIPPLTLFLYPGKNTREFADLFQQDMKKIGITILPELPLWNKTLERVRNKDFHLLASFDTAMFNSSLYFWEFFYSSNIPGKNLSLYQDSIFDKMYKELISLAPGKRRTKLNAKIDRFVAEEVLLLLRNHISTTFLLSKRLKDFSFHGRYPMGYEKYLQFQ